MLSIVTPPLKVEIVDEVERKLLAVPSPEMVRLLLKVVLPETVARVADAALKPPLRKVI